VKINLYELAQWLIQNGADINSKSESELHFHHHSPFEVACHHNNIDITILKIKSHYQST